MFEGDALLRRMVRYGLLAEEEKKLDYVLQLTTSKLLERRLQTLVFKGNKARSIHMVRWRWCARSVRWHARRASRAHVLPAPGSHALVMQAAAAPAPAGVPCGCCCCCEGVLTSPGLCVCACVRGVHVRMCTALRWSGPHRHPPAADPRGSPAGERSVLPGAHRV